MRRDIPLYPHEHVVMYSGGLGSWATAKRVAEKYSTENLYLIFADTKMEDEDLYRFLRETTNNIKPAAAIWLSEGRTPWEVMFDTRMLGNSKKDPCSRILKRTFIREWIESRFDPKNTTIYLGFDWSEEHRLTRARKFWEPWKVEAPMCEQPHYAKFHLLEFLREEGIEPPELYRMGFPHNNCGGFCIKAGKDNFKLLLKKMPERYAFHEEQEQKMRELLGKDVAIIWDGAKDMKRPVTLKELRERVEAGIEKEADGFEWGGCGCF